jgi:hypothetical protein
VAFLSTGKEREPYLFIFFNFPLDNPESSGYNGTSSLAKELVLMTTNTMVIVT